LRAASLLAVLVAARASTFAGTDLSLSVWAPFAYLWQDILATLLFLAVDARLRRARVAWLL
jgi:hypothetical protein